MARTLNESVLRALVNRAVDDEGPPEVLMVRGAPRWSGEEVIDTETGSVRIVPCVSPLAVREVLTHRKESADGHTLVILTDRDEEELGQEVLARVWRHRLLRPSRWEAAKSLFRVDRLDPALADARWLIDLLVDVAPLRGYPPPPSGFLEFTTAWRTFLRHGLRLDVDKPTLEDLLRWGEFEAEPGSIKRYAESHLAEIGDLLAKDVGPAAGHVLRIVSEGRGADLVPLGLVADALWDGGRSRDSEDPAVTTARVRFERPLGSKQFSTRAARTWGEAAERLVRRAVARGDEASVSRWLTRAETVLTDLDALELASVSDVLPWAFTKRLMKAGSALGQAVEDPRESHLEVLEGEVDWVEQHLRSRDGDGADRLLRLKMATRLVRRLTTGGPEVASDFEGAAINFIRDGAWVDAARNEIGQGETVGSLADAYSALIRRFDEERAERDREFAEVFATWSEVLPTESVPLLPIERVLDEVVTPVARRAPVLLLVLDGLSYPESTRLLADFRRDGWSEVGPDGRHLPVVVSAVPTVTSVSRASLLSGELVEGGQDTERSGFEEHAGLRDAAGGRAPRLFHKKDLKIEHGRIAPAVREVVLDPAVRVVGAVVNAVDDHLDKGSQLRLAEGLGALRPLRPLLEAAAEAGRAVVIASDHGHVLENGSEARVMHGASERWRSADHPAGEDEVKLSGPRVLRGDGEIIAPAVEKIRYISAEKRGYHGGATPQEALCPLMVITTGGVRVEGWEPVPGREPSWWQREPEPLVPSDLPEKQVPETIVDADGQGVLFTEEGRAVAPSVDQDGWIGELLDSPVFAEQRQAAGRQALDDESVATFLSVLERRGGVAPPDLLTDVTDLPPSRLRTKLEALRRMLNLDGYPVLTLEVDGTARLDLELLSTQFELDL